MTARYEIRAIAPEVLRDLRECDDAGNAPRRVVDDAGGNPLRCCLGRSDPGETLALVSYAPLRRWAEDTGADPGPYSEWGPVFIHVDECGGRDTEDYPQAMRGDRRVLRAYSSDGRILGGRYVESDGRSMQRPDDGRLMIEEELDELYRAPEVAAVHVRAVEFGCFLFETRRR